MQPVIVHSVDGIFVKPTRPVQNVAALQARAQALAQSQLGAIGQACFVLYMFVGAQLSLIGVYMLLTTGLAPFKNLLNINKVFESLDARGVDLKTPKATYALINLAGCAFFLWKLSSSGLLPVTSADWFSLLPQRALIEHSSLSFDLGT